MLIYISNKYIGNKIDKKQHLYTHFAGSDHTTVDSAARTCNTASIALGFRWKPPLRAYSQWPRESSADLYACTQHTQHNIKHLCVFFFFFSKTEIKKQIGSNQNPWIIGWFCAAVSHHDIPVVVNHTISVYICTYTSWTSSDTLTTGVKKGRWQSGRQEPSANQGRGSIRVWDNIKQESEWCCKIYYIVNDVIHCGICIITQLWTYSARELMCCRASLRFSTSDSFTLLHIESPGYPFTPVCVSCFVF